MSKDFSDLVFRLLFSLIFIGLGGEHLVSDELIQKLMPAWVPSPRLVSIFCGLVLFLGGGMIAIGYRLKLAAILLGTFLVAVTALVHAPALQGYLSPVACPEDQWMWDTLQRSNFVKNLCLLGVCAMLPFYSTGKWSLEAILKAGSEQSSQER
ncbi:DoxX family protein [Pelagicoccus sp. SDUM812005]|uniref:DoxX family protein n=1 Tax=Pelagicoccus sp. SDUM812005 TaxID=3041257 RepID=UPI002810245F|nr:DoxX family protein [Pelagicoccus sp. SDUM812005]MDQ8182159.1 DoxX family protein [Pelagicoccus sp. SDUM812005]